MPEAFIVEAVRTPVGKKNGGLSATHPVDVAAEVIQVNLPASKCRSCGQRGYCGQAMG